MSDRILNNRVRIFSLALCLALTAGLLQPGCSGPGGRGENPPNIILILADDQGWGDAQFSNNPVLQTTHLNELATQGVQMDQFFVSPMCSPTRASIMSGRYNLSVGTTWVGRRTDFLSLEEATLADLLKSGGYATGCFGKWHLGAYGPYHPNERGFDTFTGFLLGAANNYFHTELDHNGKSFIGNGYITDVLTDSALQFIARHENEPFFCYIPYNVPHHPFQVPDRYYQKYKQLGVEDDRTASVYGMIENMDENIGRILKKLEDDGIADNTIVIFLSDNGPAFERFNDGLSYIKAQVGEGSVKVPCYIKWPGKIDPNSHIGELAAHIDLLPTLLSAAGIQVPQDKQLDGIDLMPYLTGQTVDFPARKIYAHQTKFGTCTVTPGGLRTEKYRLMNWRNGYQLFDMENDPGQSTDLAAAMPLITKELVGEYETWYYDQTRDLELPRVPIGYRGHTTEEIIAPDALKSDGIAYSGRWGWATDFFIGWTNSADSVTWELDVLEPGVYEFTLNYWCPEENLGALIRLTRNQESIEKRITVPNNSDFIELPDQVKDSSPLIRNWSALTMGQMKLEKGPVDLVMKAIEIPGKNAGEFRSLVVKKIE